MPKFSNTEVAVQQLFAAGTTFKFEGEVYKVIKCAKPRPRSGECKTDVYLLVTNSKKVREIKISIKQENADFLENKMQYERALEIFGKDVDTILSSSIQQIKNSFEQQYLVLFDKYKRSEAKSIKLGWKFELLNKPGGDLSGQLNLTPNQMIDVYSGSNLPNEKKNASVDGEVIANSGVADYIMIVNQEHDYSLQECIESMISISEYVKKHGSIYYACKALNYRAEPDKWDGDRPLAVYVDWTLSNGKLKGMLKFDQPLHHKGNEVGNNLKSLLNSLGIRKNNFDTLISKLDEGVKYYKSNE